MSLLFHTFHDVSALQDSMLNVARQYLERGVDQLMSHGCSLSTMELYVASGVAGPPGVP